MISLEPRIAATIKSMLGNTMEAEDIGQETFIRLYNAIGNFRGESSLETYAVRIAINLSLNELNRQKRRNLFFSSREPEENEAVDTECQTAEKEDTRDMVNRALQTLKPGFKSIIVLRLVNGYSVKETAQILNIAEGTVLSRLARAQQKLRKILVPMMEGNHA